jgi:hypothetical protein
MDNKIRTAQQSDKPAVYETMLAQISNDSKQLLSQQKEIGRLTTENLKKSIQYQGALSEARHLRDENATLRTGLHRLKEIAFMHCEMFENIFESDEASFTYEKMKEYLDVAMLLEVQYGRKTNYIRRVQERIFNDLPY